MLQKQQLQLQLIDFQVEQLIGAKNDSGIGPWVPGWFVNSLRERYLDLLLLSICWSLLL
jgi:hypothetical protein